MPNNASLLQPAILEAGAPYAMEFTYDAETHALTTLTQSDGTQLTVRYDQFRVSHIGAYQAWWAVHYDSGARKTTVTAPEGNTPSGFTTRFIRSLCINFMTNKKIVYYETQYAYQSQGYLALQPRIRWHADCTRIRSHLRLEI